MSRGSRRCQRWRLGRTDGIVRAAAVGGGRGGSATAGRTGRDRARCGTAPLRHAGSAAGSGSASPGPAGRATGCSPRRHTGAAPTAP